MAQEYKILFPSYREEFAGITDTDTLNEDTSATSKETPEKPVFSPVRLNIILDLASFMLKHFTNEDESELSAVVLQDFRQRLNAVQGLMSSAAGMSSLTLEVNMVPTLITLSNGFLATEAKKKHYNFYTDSNREETKLQIPLLFALAAAVEKLLEEFPENPVLQQILIVRDRILTFSVDSPVSKNLTGLELLLGACQVGWIIYKFIRTVILFKYHGEKVIVIP